MNSTTHWLRRARLRGVVASGLVLFTTVVAVGQLTPVYSPWTDTVSRLASPGQPFALAARGGFVLYGALVLAGAAPLGDHAPGRERLLGGLIALFGAMAVVAGIASKDAPLAASSITSRVHVAATLLGGAAIIMAMLVVAVHSRRATARRTATLAASVTGIATIVFKLSWGSRIYGLVERFLLASPALWLVALAVQLWSTDHASTHGQQPSLPTDPEDQIHPSMVRAEMYPPEKLSPWPHIVWATLVVGVVAAILLAAGQTHMSAGDCSGIGFGCSLYGADAAGFAAIVIVPTATGILAVGHALIAAARRINRGHYRPTAGGR